jgi:plastocyanin
MRNLMPIAIAIFALAIAGAAAAKTVTVTITKNGYVPNAVSIATGDAVQFTNSDTVAHQIVFKTATGIACTPTPLVLQAAQSGTCTFQSAGKFTYSDPNAKGNKFHGTVTVTGATPPTETLTLAGAPQLVVYGGRVTLAGTLSSQKVGENVDVFATPCGQTAATKAATVQTTSGGAYTVVLKPLKNTAYAVKVKSTASSTVGIKVRPRLRLRKLAPHRYSLRVFAAVSFAGRYATFQRYNATLRRWVKVKRVLLRANSTGVLPTVVSSVSFRSAIKARLRVRAFLPQIQVGTCYRPGRSNVIHS